MKKEVVPVKVRGILPANSGCAIFLGNDEKVFVIQVEPNMGQVIGMFLRDTPKERPLTHDLVNDVFKGFGIAVERVVITDLKNSTYYARLILAQENELGKSSSRWMRGRVIAWRWRARKSGRSTSPRGCSRRSRT